jgi:hypothetical protein
LDIQKIFGFLAALILDRKRNDGHMIQRLFHFLFRGFPIVDSIFLCEKSEDPSLLVFIENEPSFPKENERNIAGGETLFEDLVLEDDRKRGFRIVFDRIDFSPSTAEWK